MDKRQRVVKSTYNRWTEAEKHKLISVRVKYDNLFTGPNANQRDGWKKVGDEMGISAQLCRQQWHALLRKYKSLGDSKSGQGVGDGGPDDDYEQNSWPFYDAIYSYASGKHNFRPPYLFSSAEGTSSRATENDVQQESNSANEPIAGPSGLSRPPRASRSRSRSRSHSVSRDSFEEKLLKQNRKLGKKIGSLMSVFGQMVKTDYPNIDVSELIISTDSGSD